MEQLKSFYVDVVRRYKLAQHNARVMYEALLLDFEPREGALVRSSEVHRKLAVRLRRPYKGNAHGDMIEDLHYCTRLFAEALHVHRIFHNNTWWYRNLGRRGGPIGDE